MELDNLRRGADRLRFPDELERQFHDDYAQKSIALTRLGLVLSLVLVALFGLLDAWAAPVSRETIWLIRFGVVCPVMGAVLFLLFQPGFSRIMQPAISLGVLITGLSFAAMLAVVRPGEPAYASYPVGLLLVIIAGYTWVRLRFWYAAVTGLVILAAYEVVAIFFQDLLTTASGQLAFASHNFFFLVATLLGMFAGYFIERLTRLEFVQRRAIAAEKARSESQLQQAGEAALRASEARFRTLMEKAPEAIVVLDVDSGRFVEASESAVQLFGLPREDLLQVGPADLSPAFQPDGQPSAEAARQKLSRALAGDHPVFEWTHRNAAGVEIPCEVRLVHLPSVGPHLVRGSVTDIRERKRAEAELELAADILKSVNDFIIVGNSLGQIIFVSPAVKTLLGYDPSEVLGEGWWRLERDTPANLLAERRYVERAARGEIKLDGQPYEHEFRRRDGETRWLTLRDTKGPRDLVIGVGHDITERKHAERRLSAQHVVTRVLAESATLDEATPKMLQVVCETLGWDMGAIWRVADGEEVLRCVETWRLPQAAVEEFEALTRRTTFSPGIGLPGRVWADGAPAWIPDIVQDQNFPRSPAAARVGLHGAFGFPIYSGDRVRGVIEFFSRKVEQPDAPLLQMFAAVGSQIGQFMERKRAEAALRENEARTRLVLDMALDAVIAIDAVGVITGWNPQAAAIFGWSEAEAIGQRLSDVIIPLEHREAHERGLRHFLATGEGPVLNRRIEITGLRRTGAVFPVELTITPLRMGATYTFSAFVRDITDRKQAEVALHRLNAELEDRVAQRTVELTETNRRLQQEIAVRQRTEAELTQAKEVAEAATRAKSTFLASMSHEIRTPMNAVIGMTSLLFNTSLTPRQLDFVETIRTAGDSLLTLVNDILDFSKIEAGKLDLESQPFELRACLESALDLLAPRAAEKGLDLGCLIDESVPAGIVGDVTRLRQILVNLVGNAIKFTEKGEVFVEVTRPSEAGGEADEASAQALTLHFSVRDTGRGIPPERMNRLFQSFTQLDASTTREYGGTGLGLAISRRLSELMGGQMWAESEGVRERGSTFHFTIVAPAAPVPLRTDMRQPRPELKGKRLLLVDDNATNRRVVRLQAETWGLQVQEAAAPTAALALFERRDAFDIAILDMYLPEMDGLALAAEIRRRESSEARLPLVLLTSVGRPESGGEAGSLAGQFAAVLTKPVKPSQLYNAIVQVFTGTGAVQDLPRVSPTEALAPATRQPLRVLLAEDVAVNQKFALHALDQIGYRADVAANGLEVLEALARQAYDVVLMDVQMPEMDGLEATRRIYAMWAEAARMPAPQRPRIIAMTANALPGDREACLAAGMDDYISKPVYLEELRAALERSRPGPSAPAGAPPPAGPTWVDRATLAEVPGGRATMAVYLEEAQGLLARLRAAVAAGEARAVDAAAHMLKSTSGYVGAHPVAVLSTVLEQQGRSGVLGPDAAAVLAQLEDAFSHTRQIIEAELDRR